MLKHLEGECGLHCSGLVWVPMAGSYEHGTEFCGSIKGG
jgi:hypothetical protein